MRVEAGISVAFEPARCPGQVNKQASQDIARISARWTFSVGGPPEVVQVAEDFRWEVDCFVWAIRFQEFTVIAHGLAALDGLADVIEDFLPGRRDGDVNLGAHLIRKVNLLGDIGFDDSGLPVAPTTPLACCGDFLLFSQFAQAALQRAAADNLGENSMQVIDTDPIWMSGNLSFYPGVQIIREFFWHAAPSFGALLFIRATPLPVLARFVKIRAIQLARWMDIAPQNHVPSHRAGQWVHPRCVAV